MIGTTLGAYKILDKIGGGGFAQVYLARDTRTNQVVALKILRSEYTEDAEFVARFQREAEALQKLPRNPHIVTLHEFGEQSGTHYIAMEYLEGHDLQEVLHRRGALPIDTAVSITAQVAEALDVALKGGVIHRDIKPANVKINPHGVAKIMDFGIARAAAETKLTRTGLFVGTPAYVAPEIWEGQPASPASDVYALGVMLCEMLLGKAPFEATTPAATMRKHLIESPPPLNSLRPDVPAWLANVAQKALDKNPAQRYVDAGQMLAALRAHGAISARVNVDTLTANAPTIVYKLPSGQVARPPSGVVARKGARPASRPIKTRRGMSLGMKSVLVLAGLFGLMLVGLASLAIAKSQGADLSFLPAGILFATPTPTPVPPTSTLAPTFTFTPAPSPTPMPATPTLLASPTHKSSPTAIALPTETLPPTGTPTRTKTPTPSRTPGPSPTPSPTKVVATTRPGMLFDFESAVNWRRGDQAYGTLEQSAQQAHSGQSSARLNYNFPAGSNNFVVFMNTVSLSGQPNAISAWVYSDNSGHFFNVWIKDAGGQVWQVPLGRVYGSGWRQLAGYIMTDQKWPWAHISGPDNGQVDYPLQFYGFVLDAVDSYSGSGTIYIDDISVWRTDRLPTPVAEATQPPPAGASPTPEGVPTVANEPRGITLISPLNGTLFRESTIKFEWSGGALQPGETFLVEILPAQVNKSGCTADYGSGGHQYSPPLTDHTWTRNINQKTGPGMLLPCAGRIEWIVHLRDANGMTLQSTPRGYFEWNPVSK